MGASGGFGVVFKIGSTIMASTPTYTAIANVESLNGLEIEAVMADITAHDSPGGFAEKIPTGQFKVADVELGLIFDATEATHANAAGGLMYALLQRTPLAYQIQFPNANHTTWTFDANVSKINTSSAQNEAIKAKVTLVVTGQPTLS
jgi:hypothetical protein